MGGEKELLLQDFNLQLQKINVYERDWKMKTISALQRSLLKFDLTPSRKTNFSLGDEEEDADGTTSVSSSHSVEVQVDQFTIPPTPEIRPTLERTVEELEREWRTLPKGGAVLPGDALRLLKAGKAKHRELEDMLGERKTENLEVAVRVRRAFISPMSHLNGLPFANFDYKYVENSCCDNVIGYVPVPVGVAGPLKINGGRALYIPLATTEGALVASTNRGCSALMQSGGVSAFVTSEGMTRAPVVEFERAEHAVKFLCFLEEEENLRELRKKFEEGSRFCRLVSVDPVVDGKLVHIRFKAKTGDAMGMNMVSKSCDAALRWLKGESLAERIPDMEIVALSGNMCTDKKAAAINWICGRGRSVVADCIIPKRIVKSVLKTTPIAISEVATAKFGSGSAMAASVGGGNAHAANIVAALFTATGQVNCDGDLYCSVTMRCMEVGTVGGGTILPAQTECLKLLDVAGASPPSEEKGSHARKLAEIVASTVLAGELSLMAALSTGDLVSSHLKYNRSRLCLNESASTPDTSLSSLAPLESSEPLRLRGKKSNTTHESKVECSNIL